MSSFKFLLSLLLVLSFSASLKASDVIDASESNFDDLVAKGVSMVKFFAPWCGHCKNLAPHWEEAATALKGHVNFIKVDATVEQALAARFDIQGYPTIKVFQDGTASDYEGGRSASDLIAFAKRRMSPTVELVRTKDALASFTGPDVVVLLYTADENGPAMRAFTTAAQKLRDSYRFGAVVSSDLFDGNVEGDVVMRKPFEDEPAKFVETKLHEDGAAAALELWIRNEAFPLVNEIGPDNYRQYIDRALPIAWLFIEKGGEGAESELPKQLLTEAAKAHKGKISFVFLDGQRYRQLLSRYGFKGDVLPVFVIESSTHFWSFPEDKPLTAASVEEFCNDYVAGKLARTILSEPVPNPATVKGLTTVVAHSMKDLVLNSDKDVMIEFYAPWCGHCKTLAPIYEALAAKVESIDTVVIAKMDATANEVSEEFQVSGFPTLYFKAAGKEPILFTGDRSEEGILSFIQKHATHPVDFSGLIAAADDEEDDGEDDEGMPQEL